nr:calcitonin a [Schistocerca gregaria]
MTSTVGVLTAMVAAIALATGSWVPPDGDSARDVENSSILEPVFIRRLTIDGLRHRDYGTRGKRRSGVVCTDVAGEPRRCFYEELVEMRRPEDVLNDLLSAKRDRQPLESHDVGKRRRTLECYIGGRMGGCDYQDIKQAQGEDQHLNSIDSPGKRDLD